MASKRLRDVEGVVADVESTVAADGAMDGVAVVENTGVAVASAERDAEVVTVSTVAVAVVAAAAEEHPACKNRNRSQGYRHMRVLEFVSFEGSFLCTTNLTFSVTGARRTKNYLSNFRKVMNGRDGNPVLRACSLNTHSHGAQLSFGLYQQNIINGHTWPHTPRSVPRLPVIFYPPCLISDCPQMSLR